MTVTHRPKRIPKAPRQLERFVPLLERTAGCPEVNLGFSVDQIPKEALRCLHCADPKCIQACPLHIDIRSFIDRLTESDFVRALETIQERNPFPSICGRVCQHERFCERACLLGAKRQPVAIGALERAAAEFGKAVSRCRTRTEAWCGRRVALAGSGPASLIAAHDLAAKGYRVTVLEALHEAGGVLIYGIPPFRLPREVVRREIEALRSLGVEFRTDFLVGKTCSIEELFAQGYDAVFLGTGAGLPKLMNIPGEDLAGVYTANEFLTRLNLMEAYRFPESDTPVRVGKQTVVVGGGNSAIDAARWARRMGSETTVMFRRGREQLRARKEEIAHAEEEGVKFDFLAQPVRLEGDERGVLCRMQGIRMRLEGEEDSARPFAVPISGSEFWVNLDTVIAAVGQGPNPTIQHTLPSLVTRDGMIAITPTGETNVPDVYAGGDVTRGGSTIIEALRDGRAAAEAIGRALRGRRGVCRKDLPLQSTPPFRILSQRELAPAIISIEIEAADIANHWQPGQFVIVRPTVTSERIPLTLVDGDMLRGTIRLVFQIVGKTTSVLAGLRPGQAVAGVLGPLGKGATIGHFGSVLCVAGGVGVAEVLPVARALRRAGNYVSVLAGARSAERQILRDELARSADEVHWATDDGSDGFHGTVLALMRNLYSLRPPAFVHVIGPVPLMRGAAAMTQEWNVPTVASLNPIMLDGTGMCGGCRVSVGGRQLFACLDGPEFDAHQVDFEQLAGRNRAYLTEEKLASCPSPCPNHDASG